MVKETTTQKKRRLLKKRESKLAKPTKCSANRRKEVESLAVIAVESATQRKRRLLKKRQTKQDEQPKCNPKRRKKPERLAIIADETATQRKRRLLKKRQAKQDEQTECYPKRRKIAESLVKVNGQTATQQKRRLFKRCEIKPKGQTEHHHKRRNEGLVLGQKRKQRKMIKRRLMKKRLKYQERQHDIAERNRKAKRNKSRAHERAVEDSCKHADRLDTCRLRITISRLVETPEQHAARVQSSRDAYIQRRVSFNAAIYTFCDKSCEICLKTCYPNQVVKHRMLTIKSYLPDELASKPVLVLCHRCHIHLRGKKNTAPSRAYWNNLLPGHIPEEIATLTEPERRLLQRIIPYVKVIKFPGRFGQYGFKGQATLFALDIFEVSEKLPTLLPRSSTDIGMVVVTETLDNSNLSRSFNIYPDRVYKALDWLIKNNPLYKDVTVNRNARLSTQDVIRVIPVEQQPTEVECNNADVLFQSSYMPINNLSRIVHASWHQGNTNIFSSHYAGRQCFAMVISNFIRATILPPSQWSTNVMNDNMIQGEGLYACIDEQTSNIDGAYPIPQNGYLEIRNLDVVRRDIIMFDKAFAIEYDDVNGSYHGSICDSQNDGVNFFNLRTAISFVFTSYRFGILVVEGRSMGLMLHDNRYYFTDSHSCGAKGKGNVQNGRACIIECDEVNELLRIVRRTVGFRANVQYSLNGIAVAVKGGVLSRTQYAHNNVELQVNEEDTNRHYQGKSGSDDQYVPIQMSVMAPIDHEQPDVQDEIHESTHLNEIVRKTKDNIVNVNREKKAEEFSWFHLFPYGNNGLNENRPVRITPLDYFQHRILGTDTRFQTNDYLFYALSMFEFYRVQSTINACGRTVRGQQGVVEDLHLHLKNLRGTASYWRTAHDELIAFIRCLGPPTWFMTLSCNDLNWLDMRKALLIADGRPNEDPSELNITQVQKLLESYPVVQSRHFSRRVDAFIKEITHNDTLLGGKVTDYWCRVEFQNRGSPHLHLVVWIDHVPSFETPEGLSLIDSVVSCHLPGEEDPEVRELVMRNQVHRHTHTCHKNNSEQCRFAFPRTTCQRTHIVSPNSDEFIRNGGRFCTLKRSSSERWVNNYNRNILKFWVGNMDIQPCGSNESIAHYIAKYISKNEPSEVDDGVARAIRQISREETNIARKLFKSCMRVLKERQVSASECVYRLCRLNLKLSSRTCVFLNTRKPEQRYHVLRFAGNQAIGICSNIFQRYTNRPRQEEQGYDFPNMCLLEFAMFFEPDYSKIVDDNEESIDADVEDPPARRRQIKLTNGIKMDIRSTKAIVRVPYFQMHSDPENYYYSLLAQYLPFYSENELIDEYSSSREAFLARNDQLRQTSAYLEIHRSRDQQLVTALNQARALSVFENPEQDVEAELAEDEITEQAMSNEQFQNACAAMNVQQKHLLNSIARHIDDQQKGGVNRVRMFVTGGAGVGKTFTFNALKELVNRCFGKQAAKVGALTGVAARLVGGRTLHTLFKLPVEKDGKMVGSLAQLTGNYLKVMRNQWKDTEFLFIDEISMVSYEMLSMIDSRLRQLKRKEDQPFGGINIMVFGDLFQLPPIRGAQVFHQPARFFPATHLWRLFSLVELTENMRQHGDTTFVDLLNALRIGQLEAPHFSILMSKLLTETSNEFAVDQVIKIYPTRALVEAHNATVLQHYRTQGTRIYKINAQDTLVNATRNANNISMENIVSGDVNKTGGLQRVLEIFTGARVMLRSNINVDQGLVNGAMGVIKEIVWPLFRRDQIYDEDIPSVSIDFGRDGIHLVKPRAVQFPALRNFGTVERIQLPLILCWACTVHKMQGCTVDNAVVYLGSALFAKGQAYVALSRVKSLNGLRIEELDCTKLTGKTPCNEDAKKEMERMRQLRPP